MTSIPNTKRRGAIYWFSRSRRLPGGNSFRPTVSLRTACPKTARRRAAILSAKFEVFCMRLFGNQQRRFSIDRDAATRIFQKEFNLTLDQLEDEREHATIGSYDFGDFQTFLDVHEEVYRYLADTVLSEPELTDDAWAKRTENVDKRIADFARNQLSDLSAIWHRQLDETASALEAQNVDTDMFFMDHAMRLRFEARLAAVQEYRLRLGDPKLRFEKFLSASVMPPEHVMGASRRVEPPSPVAPPVAAPEAHPFTQLPAEQAGAQFIRDNPKLLGSESGKREAKWTGKTRSQFETAMRLLQKSMGSKPFSALSGDDLQLLLKHFDGLPPNHHKTPRHGPMTLAQICAEADAEVKKGGLDKSSLGLNVPTLNRHFRFIRMAHDWIRKQVLGGEALDWKAFSFEDNRTAREQRDPFPVELGRKIFRLPPWHGCANARHRLKAGREVFHDSLYWVFPIIWYSGMRREEACKLQVTDIVRSAEGIWHFNIDATDAGRVKTSSSKRLIPLADELSALVSSILSRRLKEPAGNSCSQNL